MFFSLCSCGLVIFGKAASVTTQATYLGVKDYGLDTTNRDTMDDFLYRFDVDGTESVYKVSNGTKDEEGNFDSPIQNVLKEGYQYNITIEDGTITFAEEIVEKESDFVPVVSGSAGELTVKNLLQTGLMPVETTLYIYGGG